jgi:hypothetical protein
MKNYDELRGAVAMEFVSTLKKIRSNPETWEIEYLDETTGDVWVLDYPDSEYHGGGSPRLRRKK